MSFRQDKMQVVSVLDPALDVRRMGYPLLNKYLETRDIEIVRPYFVAGEHPTIFHLREVPEKNWEDFVEHGINEKQQWKRALQCALVNVENLHQRDGTRMDSGAFAQSNREMLPPETLALFAPQYRQEIGRVAYEHSFFDRRILDCFLLPLSLVGPLAIRMQESDPSAASNPSSPSARPSAEASPDSDSTP